MLSSVIVCYPGNNRPGGHHPHFMALAQNQLLSYPKQLMSHTEGRLFVLKVYKTPRVICVLRDSLKSGNYSVGHTGDARVMQAWLTRIYRVLTHLPYKHIQSGNHAFVVPIFLADRQDL